MSISKSDLLKATKFIQQRWTLKKPLTRITKVKMNGKTRYFGNNPEWEFNEKYLKFKAKVSKT